MTTQPTFEEVLGCQAALYEWAESYDTKDADRLSKCIAPTLRIDYRAFLSKIWPSMPATAFISMALDPLVLGSPLLKTQHLVGMSRYEKTSEDEITGYHQMRVAHQKYKDEGMKEVVKKGHAHGMGTIWYRRVGGVWKFAGIEPGIRWSEFDHEGIFEEGEGKFGEDGGS